MAGLSIRRILTTNLQSSVMGLSGHFHYGSSPLPSGLHESLTVERAKRLPGVAGAARTGEYSFFHPSSVSGFFDQWTSTCSLRDMISNRFDQVRALALRSRIVHCQLPPKLAAEKRPNKKRKKKLAFSIVI
jgi:hypothetical protein